MAGGQEVADRAAESFQGLLLRYRGRSGLTQRELAARVGVSTRSVENWEAGVNYPSAQPLQALTAALLEVGGLSVGNEAVEAEALWAAAIRGSPRLRTPFDDAWLADRLARRAGSAGEDLSQQLTRTLSERAPTTGERRQDWGEAPDVLGFVGRTQEVAELTQWILQDRARLVAVLGMGGIGKTTLAARLVQEVAPSFERAYWRTVRNAPSLGEWLGGAISFLSDHQMTAPDGEAAQVALLLQLLRERRCLLALDNLETLLQPGEHQARYRDGYAGYGSLVQVLGESRHQSCLVLTSREAPPELATLGSGPAVRALGLGGLGVAEAQALLSDKHLSGDEAGWAQLVGKYGGNGLALKLAAETIYQVFGGDIASFINLEQAGPGTTLGGIRRLLETQVEQRLSRLEQDLLRWIAIEREPVALAKLLTELGPSVGRSAAIEAVESLRRRSLLERSEPATAFTLQSAVLEFVTDRLVEQVALEIERGQPALLERHALIQGQAKDYVRLSQERLIAAPLLERLKAATGNIVAAEQALLALLEPWRGGVPPARGYGAGNVVNLLRLLRGDLHGLDLSRLSLRQVYLQDVDARDANLAGAHVSEAVLAEAFNYGMSVVLSADGAFLVVGTSTGEVCLWRVADRTMLLSVQGHTGPIMGVALSGDGQLVASGGFDRTVRLWEASTGKLLATLQGHSSEVYRVALSADGRLVASGGEDGTVKLWEAPGGRLVATLQGHTGMIWGVALSADGRLVASGGQDGTVRLWEAPFAEGDEFSAGRTANSGHSTAAPTSGGKLLATLQGHSGTVYRVALSADGRLVASASQDGTIKLWEAPSGRLLTTLQGHTAGGSAVALSMDGGMVVSGSNDGTVKLWEMPGGRLLASLQGHTGLVFGVALSGNGRLVASSSFDGTVKLWEAPSGRLQATLQGHTMGVWDVALSADGALLASASVDQTARLWDACSGRLRMTLTGHIGPVYGVALSADGALLASASQDGTVKLWSLAGERVREGTMLGMHGLPGGRLMATLQGGIAQVRSVALSGDGQLVASGNGDGTVGLWEAASGRLLATLQGHAGPAYGVALSRDGRLLASAGNDGTVKLWDVPTRHLLTTLPGPATGPLYRVALSDDGRFVASGSNDGTVMLWAASSGQPLATLKGHTRGVFGVALSGDGRLLASSSFDMTVKLWEVPSGRPLATLQGHTGVALAVALSADGGLVVSGSNDGTIKLWDPNSGACLRTLRGDRRYERMDITGLTGVTDAQRAALRALGAVEHNS